MAYGPERIPVQLWKKFKLVAWMLVFCWTSSVFAVGRTKDSMEDSLTETAQGPLGDRPGVLNERSMISYVFVKCLALTRVPSLLLFLRVSSLASPFLSRYQMAIAPALSCHRGLVGRWVPSPSSDLTSHMKLSATSEWKQPA